jgi:hyperosmotically inducible periplasmic protein
MKRIYSIGLWVATGTLSVISAPLCAAEADDSIKSSAAKSYVFKTYLRDDVIRTESKNGIVTLTGTVTEASRRSLAQNTVEALPGVRSVDNQLQIKGENPAEHSDTWIGLRVNGTLCFHRNLRAAKTDVDVRNGIVTLSGEASSLAQKELTTECVRDVDGVKAVKNEMTVATTPMKLDGTEGDEIDDASVTAVVKLAMRSARSASAVKPKVETTDGVVTLSGIVKDAAEKSRVTKLVTDIIGVKSVINNMAIEATVSKSNSPRPPQNLRIVSQ